MSIRTSVVVFMGLWSILLATSVSAQSALAGVVKDASGGVLPGVTVEARSPVLIEGVRTAVTDSGGQYRIVDLRPGVYSVSFTMTGFSVVTRTGIELVANFTAPINVDMRVGGIEESITVSGASPVVDLQSSTLAAGHDPGAPGSGADRP